MHCGIIMIIDRDSQTVTLFFCFQRIVEISVNIRLKIYHKDEKLTYATLLFEIRQSETQGKLTHLKRNQTFCFTQSFLRLPLLIKIQQKCRLDAICTGNCLLMESRRCLITPLTPPYTCLILKEERSCETKTCYKPLQSNKHFVQYVYHILLLIISTWTYSYKCSFIFGLE